MSYGYSSGGGFMEFFFMRKTTVVSLLFEPQLNKIKIIRAPIEDSDQPGHVAQSDQSRRCPHEETLGPLLPIERTAKTLISLGGCPG